MDILKIIVKIKFKWKNKKKAWMEMCIKSAILATSLQLVQARMVKTYPKKQETITHSFMKKVYI